MRQDRRNRPGLTRRSKSDAAGRNRARRGTAACRQHDTRDGTGCGCSGDDSDYFGGKSGMPRWASGHVLLGNGRTGLLPLEVGIHADLELPVSWFGVMRGMTTRPSLPVTRDTLRPPPANAPPGPLSGSRNETAAPATGL